MKQFAAMYAALFKIDVVKMMNHMWGNKLFDPKTKKRAKTKNSRKVVEARK